MRGIAFLALFLAGVIFYINRDYILERLVIPDIVEWEKPSKTTPPLYGDIETRQYFIPNFNGLFRVGFPLEYKEPLGARVEVSLREGDTDRELFKEIIPLKKFPQKKMRRFSFPPVWDSSGRSFYLNISAAEAAPRTGLRLFFEDWPFFHTGTRGKLYFGGRELPGELSMVTECRGRVDGAGFISFLHNFWVDKSFAVVYICMMIILLIGIVFLYAA